MHNNTSNSHQNGPIPDRNWIKILVVDDEPHVLRTYKRFLQSENYQVAGVSSGSDALQFLEKEYFNLVLADLTLDNLDGITLMQRAKEYQADICFIIVTGQGSIKAAVSAMKQGADDFLEKPVDRDYLLHCVERVLEKHQMRSELLNLRLQLSELYGMENMVGRSKAMLKLFATVRKVAASEATVLIQGESGTGKELLAKSIHHNSNRREHSLVTIDCGSLPLELLQSELFGHVKGSFTGAVQNRRGLFEEARGGTIFLDEIGEIPEPLQLSLLRVLQERKIRPVGSDHEVKVDVRVISASNRNLKEAVDRGKFRRDLYYRLAVITLNIPPLRERTEDIPSLIQHFLDQFNRRDHSNVTKVSPDAMSLLLSYSWEGNIRELENMTERAMVLAEGDTITPNLLPEELFGEQTQGESTDESASLKEVSSKASAVVEREAIINALQKTNGNRKRAAELLGISRGSLYNKMKALNIH